MELKWKNVFDREMPTLFLAAHPVKVTAILYFIEAFINGCPRDEIKEILDIAYEFGSQHDEIEEIISLTNNHIFKQDLLTV